MQNAINGRLIEVAVVMNYSRQPLYRRPTDGQHFVAGVWDSQFQLEVRNLTNERIEVLNSVDGRNTLKDEPADLRECRGMIVGPRDTWTIAGWRLNNDEIGEFFFTDPTASIERQATGGNKNAGIFGFAVYTEQQPEWRSQNPGPMRGSVSRGAGQMRGSHQESVSMGADLGTGMGAVKSDRVGVTTFQRAQSQPLEVITIQYRSYEWLVRNNVIVPDEPNAFPGTGTGYGNYLNR